MSAALRAPAAFRSGEATPTVVLTQTGFLRTQMLSRVLRVFPAKCVARLDLNHSQTENKNSKPEPWFSHHKGSSSLIEVRWSRNRFGLLDEDRLWQLLTEAGVDDIVVNRIDVVLQTSSSDARLVTLESNSSPEARSLSYVKEINEGSWRSLRIRSGVLDVIRVRKKGMGRFWEIEEPPETSTLRRFFGKFGAGNWTDEERTVSIGLIRAVARPFAIRTYEYIPALGRRLKEVEDVA